MTCFLAVARATAFGLCAVMCAVSLGCGGNPARVTEGLVPVTGTVTMNGKPLGGGSIVFIPSSAAVKKQLMTGNPAAEIDAEGGYELMWSIEQAGALPGQYQVIVKYLEGEVSDDSTPTSLIPEKFGNPATSGLSAAVKDDENVINFDLVP